MNHSRVQYLCDHYGTLRPEDVLPLGLDEARRRIAEEYASGYENVAITLNHQIALFCCLTALYFELPIPSQQVWYPTQKRHYSQVISLVGFEATEYDPNNLLTLVEQTAHEQILLIIDLEEPVTNDVVFALQSLSSRFNRVIVSGTSRSNVMNCVASLEHSISSKLIIVGQSKVEYGVLGFIIALQDLLQKCALIHRNYAIGASVYLQESLTSLRPNESSGASEYPSKRAQKAVANLIGTSSFIFTSGGSLALNCAIKTILLLKLHEIRDRSFGEYPYCLCPMPHYPGYDGVIRLNGLRPLYYNADWFDEPNTFLENIRHLIRTYKPIILLFNSPHNPTGKFIPKHSIEDMVHLAAQYNMYVILDEAFDGLIFDAQKRYTMQYFEHPYVIRCGSLNKRFPQLADDRIGYLAGPVKILEYARQLHQLIAGEVSESALNSVAQVVDETSPWLSVMDLVEELEDQLRVSLKIFDNSSHLISLFKPDGGIFIRLGLPSDIDCRTFSLSLRQSTGIWCANAYSFGIPDNWIRFRFAVPRNVVLEHAKTIAQFIRDMRRNGTQASLVSDNEH